MKRRSLALIFAILSVYAAVDFATGLKAWDQAKSTYLAAGESLDPTIRFATPVPAEDNFGAIPELAGIKAQNKSGEVIREKLKLIGFRDPSVRYPRGQRSLIRGHSGSSKQDFSQLHRYYLETEILPVSPAPENFARDLRQAMESSHGEILSGLFEASSREHAIFLPLLSETLPGDSILMVEDIEFLQPVQTATRGLMLYSLTLIRTNEPDKAIDSIRTMLRLGEAASADGKSLIHFLVAQAIQAIAVAAIWDGVDARVWNADQLQELESLLARIDPRDGAIEALRVEAIATDQILELIASDPDLLATSPHFEEWKLEMAPLLTPWIDHNRAHSLNLFHEAFIVPLKGTKPYCQVNAIARERVEKSLVASHRNPRRFLSDLGAIALRRAIVQAARHQAGLTNAITACQLERYFIKHKIYPAKLEALVPEFAKQAPLDPMNNRPLPYKRTPDGRYQLHSIGIDGNDDDGTKGDIVWNYLPAP